LKSKSKKSKNYKSIVRNNKEYEFDFKLQVETKDEKIKKLQNMFGI
jgi:hypothetical protein